LEISDLREAQLVGRADVDVGRLVEASAQLERALCRGDHAVALEFGSPQAEEAARARMRQILCQIDPGDGGVVSLSDQIDALRERCDALELENRELQAELDELRAPPQSEPPTEPQPQPSNVLPLDGAARANAARPPDHYLKQTEPWERFTNSDRYR
jgi:hypothetical protein